MSHFNQPNLERKICVWTTKYKRKEARYMGVSRDNDWKGKEFPYMETTRDNGQTIAFEEIDLQLQIIL